MKTSAPQMASAIDPLIPARLVRAARSVFTDVRSPLLVETMPCESATEISPMPASSNILVTATPAAPAPDTTTRRSATVRPVTLAAFSKAAKTTIAVPCWSSWKTGISSSCCKRCSISKHLGAEISSRLTPPYAGAIRTTVSIISSTFVVSRQIGTALTPPKSLKSSALPSITGNAPIGPISPRPSTAVPSVTISTVLAFQVYR